MNSKVEEFLSDTAFSDLDRSFARFILKLDSEGSEELVIASACVSLALSCGHTYWDFTQESIGLDDTALWWDASEWRKKLRLSNLVGNPGAEEPLILDENGLLYLHRYWDYERRFIESYNKLSSVSFDVDLEKVKEGMVVFFPDENIISKEQVIAALKPLFYPVSLVSGAPGTGKTTTILKSVALLQYLFEGDLTIALVAPTGKAVARLQESIATGLKHNEFPEEVKGTIPVQASTIHRLLGTRIGSKQFKYNRDNLLNIDVLIVDESSMVDLPLMCKLFEALKQGTRVVLIGDSDQLAPVDAGSVFRNLFHNPLLLDDVDRVLNELLDGAGSNLTQLRKSYRFQKDSNIAQLCSLIREGSSESTLKLLQKGGEDLEYLEQEDRSLDDYLEEELKASIHLESWRGSPQDALQSQRKFQVLCATNRGEYGVEAINNWASSWMIEQGAIYHPIMITQNSYIHQLFNGDMGVIDFNGNAYFLNAGGELISFQESRLPQFVRAYALTVHKSQGSEFEKVALVLSKEESPVLTRELLYTAVSRASKKVSILSSEEILNYAISRPELRLSGLK